MDYTLSHRKSRYFHLMTRAKEFMKVMCLDSVRKVILMLDNLVSKSENVYNGVVR